MEFADLSNEEFDELMRLSRYYWQEAKKCKKAKIYLAGCIMAASALEASILVMVHIYTEEAYTTNCCPEKRNKIKPILTWNLAELLKVAKQAGWLPYGLELSEDWNNKKAKIGDHIEVIRMIRNLTHPGNYMREHYKKRVTKRYAEHSLDMFLIVRDHLLQRLIKTMEERAE